MSLNSFDFETTTRVGGDLATFLGLNNLVDDKAVSLSPKPSLPVLKTSQLEDVRAMFFSTNSAAQFHAIVFHDSFAYFMHPFWGYHFQEVTYISSYRLVERWIGIKKPDVVISEMVERNFNTQDPSDLGSEEDLK